MAETSQKRDLDGILVLDKPPGCTSNGALQRVKRIFTARKAGHTGSLDMQATGVLPICFGRATKISSFLLEADKEYRALCRLGVTTTTGDGDGEVLEEKPVTGFGDELLEQTLASFRGTIKQIPPMHSALRHKGQRLYKLARMGIEVDRPARTLNIYKLHLEKNMGTDLTLFVSCSKGTYIRTLVSDIGQMLGCGAHLADLRRLKASVFACNDMITMETLEAATVEERDAMLLPIDTALQHYPDVTVNQALKKILCQGHPVLVPQTPGSGLVRLYDDCRQLFGIGKILPDGRLAPDRILQVNGY